MGISHSFQITNKIFFKPLYLFQVIKSINFYSLKNPQMKATELAKYLFQK